MGFKCEELFSIPQRVGGGAGRQRGLHSASRIAKREREGSGGRASPVLGSSLPPWRDTGITSPEQLRGSCGRGELLSIFGSVTNEVRAGGAERRHRDSPPDKAKSSTVDVAGSGVKGFGVS